jgi:hypothetical protein
MKNTTCWREERLLQIVELKNEVLSISSFCRCIKKDRSSSCPSVDEGPQGIAKLGHSKTRMCLILQRDPMLSRADNLGHFSIINVSKDAQEWRAIDVSSGLRDIAKMDNEVRSESMNDSNLLSM